MCYNHKTKYTDVPYQMMVGGAFVTYVKTCERGRIKDFEQQSHVYNAFFPVDRDNRVIMESQCSDKKNKADSLKKSKFPLILQPNPLVRVTGTDNFLIFMPLYNYTKL